MSLHNTQCCGIKEYSGLQGTSAVDVLMSVGRDMFNENIKGSIIWFSDKVFTSSIGESSTGYGVQKYIRQHKLGTVTATTPTKNYNSGNQIVMWIWIVDRDAFRDWYSRPSVRIKVHSKLSIKLYAAKQKLRSLLLTRIF